MAKLAFDEDIQPYLDEAGQLSIIEGRKAAEQHVSLKIQDALYGILSEYNSDDVEAKIRKEVVTIVRETDYLNTVDRVAVRRIRDETKDGSYFVEAQLQEADNISLTLPTL